MGDISQSRLDLTTYEEKYINGEHEGSNYDFVFIPIENIEGNEIGYFISTYSGNIFAQLQMRYISYAIGATLFVWSSFAFILVIDIGRRRLKNISQHDPLTGSYNRRYLDQFLENEIARTKRTGNPFSMLLLDIDLFKDINDTYGHLKGDEVLENLVNTIDNHIRQEDIIARFGGEEFIIVLVNTPKDKALKKAKQLKHLIENSNIANINITVSLGVTEYTEESTIDSLIHEADKALYYAKETGRNRAVLYDMEMDNNQDA
ncbi:MAG: GGDEF domain-containing protein [Candidatus Izemoplasma sp.]|nr:GGDEF domain-containing protein [Candidatus Izemoplasma sp.]